MEYERLIHSELRLIRQRAVAAPAADSRRPRSPARGERRGIAVRLRPVRRTFPRLGGVRAGRAEILPAVFRGTAGSVLDIGCGRGEFLELMREAGVPARGIDLERGIGGAVPQQGTAKRKKPICSRTWRTSRKRRSTASSARRWWSICRPIGCPR